MPADPELHSVLPQLVVVTGTASGLGESIAKQLTERGVKTFGVDISEPPAALTGDLYTHFKADVSAEDAWEEIGAAVSQANPMTLGLVTSAAVLDVGTVLSFDKAAMEKTMAVNFIGTALAFRAMIPLMVKRGGGSIVAVASIDATFAEQQLAVYAASKGAVRQLTRTVAMDHAREGVRANVLSPGPMLAGLFKRHMESANDPSRFLATRAARQPGGRILDPAEIAQSALFLLSESSSALTGAEIVADGGLTTSFDFRTGSEGASV